MALFGITRRKLEEGFGSLVGNIGQLFNNVGGAVNNVVQPAVRNVQQQVQPAAQQVAQQWEQTQNYGNTLRQQAQNLANQAINNTVRETSNFADRLGYSKEDQFNDNQRLQNGDLSALSNPLTKGSRIGLRALTDITPFAIGAGTAQATVDAAQGKEFNPVNRIDRAGDFTRGIAQQGVNTVANIPSSAAAFGTWKSNNIDQPIARTVFGEDYANKLKQVDERTAKSLYGAGNVITKAGEDNIQKTDPNSAYSKGGDIAGQVGIGLAGSSLKAASLPFWYTQAMGRTGKDTYNDTGDLGKASTVAMTYAPVEAALEKVGSKGVLSPAEVFDNFVGSGLKNTAKEAARGFIAEGGTEAAQQFAENLTKNKVYNPKQSLMEGVPESFVIGGAVGGSLRGIETNANYKYQKAQNQAQQSDFTKQLDEQLNNLNNTVTGESIPEVKPNEQINPQESINPQNIPTQTIQSVQAPQTPRAPQAPETIPVNQTKVPELSQEMQNLQRDIANRQPYTAQVESTQQLLDNYKIPEQNTQNQQALSEAKVQAQDIATLYKMDPATAQRLIENYGYANVAALAQEVSKSGTARSVDAVVVSEAVKRWGKPKSQMTDAEPASLDQTPEAQQANTVATQPTQTVPQEQQPVMDAEAQSYVANQLPYPDASTDVEAEANDVYLAEQGWSQNRVDDIINEGQQLGMSQQRIDQEVNKYKDSNPRPVETPSRIVDTSTGEITNREKIIANADTQMRNFIDSKILPAIEGQPFTVEQFTREIQEADRNGTNPSPAVARFYDKNIAPLIKAMAINVNREDVLKHRWYLPQFKAGQEQQINVGGSLVNKIDVEDFIFSKVRENKIPLDQLDYSLEGLNRLAVQEAAYKARHIIRGNEIQQELQQDGIDITQEKAVEAAKKEDALYQQIRDSVGEAGVIKSGMQKMDLVDRIRKLGELKGKDKVTIDTAFGKVKYAFSSIPELLDNSKYPPTGESLLDASGWNRYTEAEGLGHGMVQDSEGLDIQEYLQDRYKNVDISQEAKDKIIKNAAYRLQEQMDSRNEVLSRIDNLNQLRDELPTMSIFKRRQLNSQIKNLEQAYSTMNTAEYQNEMKSEIFKRAEMSVSREQMLNFLETADFKNKNLKQVFNYEAKRILLEDAAKRSLATKITDGALGLTYQAGLGWNAMSALQNITELKRAYAEFNTDELAYGVKMAKQHPEITKEYGVTPTKMGDITEVKGQLQKSGKVIQKLKPMAAFYWTESIKDRVMLHAFEYRHRNGVNGQPGLQGVALKQRVRSDFDKLAIKAGQRGTLGFNKSNLGRLMMQYLQYPIKDLKITGKKLQNAFTYSTNMQGMELTNYDINQARKFIAKKALSDILLYLLMNAAIGSTWEYISGLQNPFDTRIQLGKDAGTDEKIVAHIPGGMVLSPFKELYINMREEARNAQEKGVELTLQDNLKKQSVEQAKKSWTSFVPGGNQFFRKTGGFIEDQQRGYNQSRDGRARFAATDNPLEMARGAVFGRYTTNNAREYFGNAIASDFPIVGKKLAELQGARKYYPVGDRFQKMINDGQDVKSVIIRSREYDKKKEDFKNANPTQQAILNDINKTTYNPATGKKESDVISPEKWDKVNSDQTLTLYNRLKQKAIDDNKEFGYAIDPIYTLTDPQQIKEILKIRSLPTGDDTELKQMNTAKHQWYRDFTAKEKTYYEQVKSKGFEQNDEYGPTERKKAYIDSGSQYPQHTDLVKKYFDIKNKDANAGKEFYKANRDQLAKDFETNKKAAFEWTNRRRALEGAQPLTWEAFNNVTFGYEDDEAKVFKQLGFKLGEFGSNGKYSKDYNAYKKAINFSQPTIRIAAPKPGTLKVPKGKTVKATYKVPKIIVKTSKA